MDEPVDPRVAVGKLIRTYRVAHHLSQSAVARHLRVRPSVINRVERGQRRLNPRHLPALCSLLDIQGADFAHLLRLLSLDRAIHESVERVEERETRETVLDAFRHTALVRHVTDQPRYLREWVLGRFAVGRYRADQAVRTLKNAEQRARDLATDELYSIISLDYADALILASRLDDADRIMRERCLPVSANLLAERPDFDRAHMAMARAIITEVNAAYNHGDEAACWAAHQRAVPHLTAAGDHCGWAKSLFFLALFRFWQGRLTDAARYARMALAHARQITLRRDVWWSLRDALWLSKTWWEAATLALLIDITAAAGQIGTEAFDELIAEWAGARPAWVRKFPPFTPRYRWLEARTAAERVQHREEIEYGLAETATAGCWNIHTDLQIVYGDFLRWADPHDAGRREAAQSAYRAAQEIARTRGFALHLQSAERRLMSEAPPFPGLAR